MSEIRTSFDEVNTDNGHRVKHDPRVTREDYWWAWATDPASGRIIVLGWNGTESDMQREAFEKFGKLGISDFEVIPLRTRERGYARDLCNAQRVDKGIKVEDLLKRAKYTV